MSNKTLTVRRKSCKYSKLCKCKKICLRSKLKKKTKVKTPIKIKKGGYVYGGSKKKKTKTKTRKGGYVYGGNNCSSYKTIKGGSNCGCGDGLIKTQSGGNFGIQNHYPYNSSGGMNPPQPGGNDITMKGGGIFVPYDNSPVSTFGNTLGGTAANNLMNGSNNSNSDPHSIDGSRINTMV
jgi:hypothetical protein